ncbi:MAG: GIY-YIG nuclease family protein [Methanobacterium paludis]|nr:GIY-YIG nuclease family protein [Methanobacterium paludis]
MYTIYKITNPIGESYIGMTKKPLNERLSQHHYDIEYQPKKKISKSFKKYGFENHSVSVIEVIKSEHEAKIKEAQYIKLLGKLNTRFGLNVNFNLSELKKQYNCFSK